MIRVYDLTKIYPRAKNGRGSPVTAVDRVCLTIDRGEVFALLGPNGDGKRRRQSLAALHGRACERADFSVTIDSVMTGQPFCKPCGRYPGNRREPHEA